MNDWHKNMGAISAPWCTKEAKIHVRKTELTISIRKATNGRLFFIPDLLCTSESEMDILTQAFRTGSFGSLLKEGSPLNLV